MNPVEQRLLPPDGFFARFRYYAGKYGCVHAACAFLGRKSSRVWGMLGPVVTRKYLARWLRTADVKIVNLGGGGLLYERWLTADIDPRSDVYVDLTKRLPFPNESIDVVYLEEAIEHVARVNGIALIQECCRILKTGGVLRLTTPSLNFFVRSFLSNPHETRAMNDMFRLYGHLHIYSEEEMKDVLMAAGFSKIVPSRYRDEASRFGYFDTHPERFSFAPAEWSQYWEAEK
jgi:predicted SAM-dependent methyltransferase